MTSAELAARARAIPVDISRPADGPRRALNVAVAAASLVIAAPVMLAIAAAVKLTSPGPALYRQTRVGLDRRRGGSNRRRSHGRSPQAGLDRRRAADRRKGDGGGSPFTIYKFRTMYVTPGQNHETWAVPDDPRVTPLGRFLRRTRLAHRSPLRALLLRGAGGRGGLTMAHGSGCGKPVEVFFTVTLRFALR